MSRPRQLRSPRPRARFEREVRHPEAGEGPRGVDETLPRSLPRGPRSRAGGRPAPDRRRGAPTPAAGRRPRTHASGLGSEPGPRGSRSAGRSAPGWLDMLLGDQFVEARNGELPLVVGEVLEVGRGTPRQPRRPVRAVPMTTRTGCPPGGPDERHRREDACTTTTASRTRTPSSAFCPRQEVEVSRKTSVHRHPDGLMLDDHELGREHCRGPVEVGVVQRSGSASGHEQVDRGREVGLHEGGQASAGSSSPISITQRPGASKPPSSTNAHR